MRKHLSLFLFCVCCFVVGKSSAQSQKGFSFQGYARDFEGAALSSQSISVRFSIYPQGGSTEYEETQSATTDPYGVFQLIIGSTKPVDFAKIDFSANKYWLKVETKAYGSEFVEISNTELLAVPYAKSAENGVPAGTILPFGGSKSKIPVGYLACDGATYTTNAYPVLFSAIGNAWGGSGTSFQVPDLRGFFLRGLNDGSGVDPDAGGRYAKNSGGANGDNVGSYQGDTFSKHNHGVNDSGHGHGVNDPGHNHNFPNITDNSGGGAIDDAGGGGSRNTSTEKTNISIQNSTTGLSIKDAGSNENRPKNANVLYIIKY